MKWWKPYLWRLILLVAGLISAILFLVIGFEKTMLILLLSGIGVAIGTYKDKGIPIVEKEYWNPCKWRVIFAGFGIITAILFMVIGFRKTLFLLLFAGIGYLVGMCKDRGISLVKWIEHWREKWR